MMSAQTGGEQEFVELDPTGRYGRYNEILGKGSSKTVYRAFDEYEGIEVAWNQVKLHDFLQSPEELERLYCEIHLLKTLKHKNIMKFYTSWVDTSNRNINFVTEMFTSGTLRQYRQKHRRVNMRAVKNWCRQILSGLLYLHSHDPPVIHRDLKCDNIFINGNQGQVKIGDLGLAAILKKSHADHCVGTPEFMAPEVYEEQYNELVDIYSFGMCILEMVTFEYPYSECTHPAQIYKKVISGMKPDALYKVQDPEIRKFVEKCLATVSRRLPARELLKDPFLRIDDVSPSSSNEVVYDLGPIPKQPSLTPQTSDGYLLANWIADDVLENGWEYDNLEVVQEEIELFSNHEDEHLPNVDITIKGKRKSDGSIYLKLRITDKEGRRRNIHFPFDIEVDTALSVATEMVAELDIVDFDVMSIAEMIDGEVGSLVPEWRPGLGLEDILGYSTPAFCHNCKSAVTSYGSLSEILSAKNPGNSQGLHCSRVGCMHGRFAEVTYQMEESSEQHLLEELSLPSSKLDGGDDSLQASRDGELAHASEDKKATPSSRVESVSDVSLDVEISARESMERLTSGSISEQLPERPEVDCQHCGPNSGDDYESEIQQELRWLKAKYQMELREYTNQQIEGARKAISPHTAYDPGKLHPSDVEMLRQLNLHREISSRFINNNGESSQSETSTTVDNSDESYLKGTFHSMQSQGVRSHVVNDNNGECAFTGKNYYTCNLLPGCLSRTKSLPVDAIDT